MPEFTLVKERTMKLSKLVGDRFKERPANCQIDSHALMGRGGYIKNVANVFTKLHKWFVGRFFLDI